MSEASQQCSEVRVTPLAELQRTFVRDILPTVKAWTVKRLRHLRQEGRHADHEAAMADVTALAWKSTLQIAKGRKDPVALRSAIARFSVRQYLAGRSVAGQEKASCVYSGYRAGKLELTRLPHLADEMHLTILEALRDASWAPVPDQVAFRLDVPAWLARLTARQRTIAVALMLGHGTGQLARRLGVTPGAISQLRRWLHDNWERFTE